MKSTGAVIVSTKANNAPDSTQIVAYLEKGVWYKPDEVYAKRNPDRHSGKQPELVDANPYTIRALRNRREAGRDVPEWVDLDNDQK